MSPALEAVEAIYFNAQARLNDMLAACHSEEERIAIRTQYVLTRHNYFVCINKTFHDDDPALQADVALANAVALELKAIDAQLGDITKVINTMTTAVAYGAKIVTKIMVL
ncbi:MAG: hypothetical protein ACRYF4_12895 [Janthinobacterium lividum]